MPLHHDTGCHLRCTALLLSFFLPTFTTAVTTPAPPTWSFAAYTLPNCASTPVLSINGSTERDCSDTTQLMQSYRFSSTTNEETNETYSVRLYDQAECLYLSMIHDERDGECQEVGFRSWNVFGFER
ncbi:hypothetical protein B0T16DRAFT_407703 [Cercophora newfieldiana]|uniref:Uncharacterized protein n=1 Tax=Cercophora newfieldiana TaxID=92897 RepID=A0AA39Y9A6_9PEZI|nr:hypothetical protein B0T16DRAFT_407703 [Cercophora newfieldiana]